MTKVVAAFGLTVMTVVAAGVAIYSLRYLGVPFHITSGIDPKILGVIDRVPAQALTHMLLAPVALLLGPLQFIDRVRIQHARFHRLLGQVYVAACVVAGLAALATAPFASGGPIAGSGFGVLAVLWVVTTLRAWQAAVQGKFQQHRLLMRYSYAMTFAAVTLRLQIPVGLALGSKSYSTMSVWLAYSSWIPNVAIVWLYSRLSATQRSKASLA